MPEKAGTQASILEAPPLLNNRLAWVPACARMTFRHTMAASLVSSESTRHQWGSKSAPMGQTLAL